MRRVLVSSSSPAGLRVRATRALFSSQEIDPLSLTRGSFGLEPSFSCPSRQLESGLDHLANREGVIRAVVVHTEPGSGHGRRVSRAVTDCWSRRSSGGFGHSSLMKRRFFADPASVGLRVLLWRWRCAGHVRGGPMESRKGGGGSGRAWALFLILVGPSGRGRKAGRPREAADALISSCL